MSDLCARPADGNLPQKISFPVQSLCLYMGKINEMTPNNDGAPNDAHILTQNEVPIVPFGVLGLEQVVSVSHPPKVETVDALLQPYSSHSLHGGKNCKREDEQGRGFDVVLVTTHHPSPPLTTGEECVGEGKGGLKNPPSNFTKYQRDLLILSVNELLNSINRPAVPDANLDRMVAELKDLYYILQTQRSIDELMQDSDPHDVCMAVISYSKRMIHDAHSKAGHPPAVVDVSIRYENGGRGGV